MNHPKCEDCIIIDDEPAGDIDWEEIAPRPVPPLLTIGIPAGELRNMLGIPEPSNA